MLSRGFLDDEIGEHSLPSAANHCASLYKVVIIDAVLLCSCISPTWLHSVCSISLLLKAGLQKGNVAPAADCEI